MCTHCNHGELIRYLKIHGYWPPIVQSSVVTLSVNEVCMVLLLSIYPDTGFYSLTTSLPAIRIPIHPSSNSY